MSLCLHNENRIDSLCWKSEVLMCLCSTTIAGAVCSVCRWIGNFGVRFDSESIWRDSYRSCLMISSGKLGRGILMRFWHGLLAGIWYSGAYLVRGMSDKWNFLQLMFKFEGKQFKKYTLSWSYSIFYFIDVGCYSSTKDSFSCSIQQRKTKCFKKLTQTLISALKFKINIEHNP